MGTPVFGQPRTFEEAFPTVQSARVRVSQAQLGDPKLPELFAWPDGPHFRALLHCRNPLCKGGGFDIQAVLSGMVSDCATERAFSGKCRGHESMGRGQTRTCMTFFTGSVEIEYRDEDAVDQPNSSPWTP